MLPVIIATVVGGVLVFYFTQGKGAGLLNNILPSTPAPNPLAQGAVHRGIQIGAQGTSPYQSGGSPVGYGLQAAGLGDSAAGAGIFGSTVAVSPAIPIIGVGIAVGAAIFGILQQHHQRAVAQEASVLNNAVPHFRQTLVQVCAAVLSNQITDQAQFNSVLDGLVADYYTEVSKIIHGRWPVTSWPIPAGKAPNPCNGPCVVGHWWIEGDSLLLKTYGGGLVTLVKSGKHGSIPLEAVPAHAGFNGAPAISISY